MRAFNYAEISKTLLTPEIVRLLTSIHEFKGEQNLFVEANADKLNDLLTVAKIQSTEYSNKIEGIYTSDERLKQIMNDKTIPQSRVEEEIAGYRDVLNTIHMSYDSIPILPSILLQLHRDLYKFSGMNIGGKYKSTDNIIAEIKKDGSQHVRFNPVPSWQTEDSMRCLCESYTNAYAKREIDSLLLIPMFILDFLCIHPFDDGNGRMSRLLTLLMLYREGYIVGKYISIEKVIENSKETYYETLQQSSIGWHEGKNDYVPFVKYILGTIIAAYRDFESRVDILSKRAISKPERIEELIKKHLGAITKREILELCPDISGVTIQRTLKSLIKGNMIIKIGGGRYSSYKWNWEQEESK